MRSVAKRHFGRPAAAAKRYAIWFLHYLAIGQMNQTGVLDAERTIGQYGYLVPLCFWYRCRDYWRCNRLQYGNRSRRTLVDRIDYGRLLRTVHIYPWALSRFENCGKVFDTISRMDAQVWLPHDCQIIFGVFFFHQCLLFLEFKYHGTMVAAHFFRKNETVFDVR